MEQLEERALLAGFQLLGLQPNADALLNDGDIRNVAFTELTFRFNDGQQIDPTTLSGIQVTRSGEDGVFSNGNDIVVTPGFTQADGSVNPGYVGIGDTPNKVVMRFAETLPDDVYRIQVFGDGPTPLKNTLGQTFDNVSVTPGIEDYQIDVELNLGPQITSIVPQPLTRDATTGALIAHPDQIYVYFNNDKLDPVSAQNPAYYQVLYTNNTVTNLDDGTPLNPASVVYDASLNRAILTFNQDLSTITIPGVSPQPGPDRTFRVRIGNAEQQQLAPVRTVVPGSGSMDPTADGAGSTFTTAYNVGSLDTPVARSQILESSIDPELYTLQLPGADNEPGHRNILVQDHLLEGGDNTPGITTQAYNFQPTIGFLDQNGNGVQDPGEPVFQNFITDQEKQRAREIFEIYGQLLGIQFYETPNQGYTIATGDMRAIDPTVPTGPLGVLGLSEGGNPNGRSIMDVSEAWDDGFGDTSDPNKISWFTVALHEIGHLLGLGHTDELPPDTIMNGFVRDPSSPLNFDNPIEPIFPSDQDIVHGQFLYRPESKDIDMYQFNVTQTGLFSAETIAQRLPNANSLDQNSSSLLNTNLILFDADGNIIARNDDYFSDDSFLQLELKPGTYYVGVTASGNDQYDPKIFDSGFGGTTQGPYDLRLDFRPDVSTGITDTGSMLDPGAPKQLLDGDNNGVPGGVYNFWFRTQDAAHTIVVDKSAPTAGADGSLAHPYNEIDVAMSQATQGSIVRIVGNHDDNPYLIGKVGNTVLADGVSLEVPKNVTVMIDSSDSLGQAVFKLFNTRISVGSSTTTVDRSGGALQVLGTPETQGSVVFTSLNDGSIGGDTQPVGFNLKPGDWGGLRYRNDIDNAASHFNWENQGIFLDYVNHADIRYGGGTVPIGSQNLIVDPVSMIEARPTVTYNEITNSADAAIDADPNSFQENNFHAPKYQLNGEFTPDYTRVGPDVHGNHVVQNSINGLLVRVTTLPGQALRPMTVTGRWNATDIVYVLTDNLVIQGNPGGPVQDAAAPPVVLTTLTPGSGGTLADGTYNYRIAFVDANGNEGPTSNVTASAVISTGGTNDGSITLKGLPLATAGFVTRRIYRSDSTGGGQYHLVAEIVGNTTTYTDTGTTQDAVLTPLTGVQRARLDASLTIDPNVIVKMAGTTGAAPRIDVGISAQLIAEAQLGREVVFTSAEDDTYGAGGTMDTKNDGNTNLPHVGDWAGIAALPFSHLSIDHAVIRYGGGVSQIGGTTAGFNVIEIDQAKARITNSVIENNADGTGGQAPLNRVGRGFNDSSTIFVRGAQPVIVGNVIQNNAGAAISVNVDALNSTYVPDLGRSTGSPDVFSGFENNQGPLVRLNRLGNNGVNGMLVRGQTLTTQSVWDDTDVVHVVKSSIYVPDFHAFGGLRLESSPNASLVVKFEGADSGLTATGVPLDITDRIGGSVDIVGQPGHPVVLTSIKDDTAGAGFDPQGNPQNDTNNDSSAAAGLPTGPEVDRGTLIDNDVSPSNIGYFGFNVGPGGQSGYANGEAGGGITAQGNTQLLVNSDVIYQYMNFVDVGSNGGAVDLASTTITQPPTLIAPDEVTSKGTFTGQNGNLIEWTTDTKIANGQQGVTTSVTFNSDNPLGNLRFINYLDEDVLGFSDDLLYLTGTPGTPGFLAYTLDGPQRIGFAQGGSYVSGPGLSNATFDGWTADKYSDLRTAIQGAGTTYSVAGNINTTNLTPFTDPQLGNVFGLADVTTAFAWSVDPNATDSTITTMLQSVPQNPASAGTPGDWRGVLLDQYSNDRNVAVVDEAEAFSATPPGTNATVNTAQYLGGLAPNMKSGDENLRLGFNVYGSINAPNDQDVYSFQALPGTEVWFDIDRTTMALDTVLELLDSDGNVIARSDNSINQDQQALIPGLQVNPLNKTPFYTHDMYSTNPRDAGMRVVLPGATSSDPNTYHILVRSHGITQGNYMLQLRLGETQEIPGSTIQYADIRYATNGITVSGVPAHSPLGGEAGDTDTNANSGTNNTPATAQDLGNLLNTDQAALNIAGALNDYTDVDFYRVELNYTEVQSADGTPVPTIFDLNYANNAGGPDATISVFDAAGHLILISSASNIADDLSGPLTPGALNDLLRGSAGNGDPYIGATILPQGTYYVAVCSSLRRSTELQQFFSANPANPLVRLEPNPSVHRIVDDHIGVPNNNATVPVFLDSSGIVPWNLGDVTLYVSTQNPGANSGTLLTADPFTGASIATVGNFGRDVGAIAMRSDGSLVSLTHDTDDGQISDSQSGNYIIISTANAGITNVNDDTIQTFILAPGSNPPADQAAGPNGNGVGIQFEGMSFNQNGSVLYAVGNRGDANFAPNGVARLKNILYVINPSTGIAYSSPALDRTAPNRFLGAGTQIVERGSIDTGTGTMQLVNATDQNPASNNFQDPFDTLSTILDGLRFRVSPAAGSPVTYEFDLGVTSNVNVDPALVPEDGLPQRTIQDGDYFTISVRDTSNSQNNTNFILQYDTGYVVNVEQPLNLTDPVSNIKDGDTIKINVQGGGSVTLEMVDTSIPGNTPTPGNIAVNFNSTTATKADVVNAIVNRINSLGVGLNATTLPGTGRITIAGPANVTNVTVNAASQLGLNLVSSGGVAPLLNLPTNGLFLSDGMSFTLTDGATGVGSTFEFNNAGSVTNPNEVQTLGIAGATGGTFDMTLHLYNGYTVTVPGLAYNATAADVQTAVDTALLGVVPGYSNGDLAVSGADVPTGLTFTYGGSLARKDHGQLTVDTTNLTGPAVPAIATTTQGTTAIFFTSGESQTLIAQSIVSALAAVSQGSQDFNVNARYQGGRLVLMGNNVTYANGAFAPPMSLVAAPAATTLGGTNILATIPINETDTAAAIAAATALKVNQISSLTGGNNPAFNLGSTNPNNVQATSAGARWGFHDNGANTRRFQSIDYGGMSTISEQQTIQFTGASGTYDMLLNLANYPTINVPGINVSDTTAMIQQKVDAAVSAVVTGYSTRDVRISGDATSGITIDFNGASVAGQNDGLTAVLNLTAGTAVTTTTVQGGVTQLESHEQDASGNLSAVGQNSPGPGVTMVPIDVDSTASQIAQLFTAPLPNGIFSTQLPQIQASAGFGGLINFSDATMTPLPATAPGYTYPIVFTSNGAGGTVTGLAQVGADLYAVDDNGGLYLLHNPTSPGGLTSDYLTQILDPATGMPIHFEGVTVGPPSVENGIYGDMMFGMSSSGKLYAFDTSGVLQPIFLNGAKSVQIAINGQQVTGLDFSTLDQNLFHVTPRVPYTTSATPMDVRVGAASQVGQSITVDEQQNAPGHGGAYSVAFGQGNVGGVSRTIDFPGGAHGAIESNLFSLKGYSANDLPTLYFNYFAQTENAAGVDAFHVYISGSDGGGAGMPNQQWTLLGSTDSNLYDYSYSLPNSSQFWRQVRIPLGAYAGQEGLRLRFEFSTSGDFNFGDAFTLGNNEVLTTGSELRGIPGGQLQDGQITTISALPNGGGQLVNFEYDLGTTLIAPEGARIDDGDQFTINDGVHTVTFEFDDGTGPALAAGVRPVPFGIASTAATLAQSMVVAINNAVTLGLLNVAAYLNDNRINVPNATVTTTAANLLLQGAPGVTPGNVAVEINAGMTSTEVATALADALEAAFSGGGPVAVPPPVPIDETAPNPTNDTLATAFDSGLGLGAVGLHTYTGSIGDNPTIPAIFGPAADVDLVKLDLAANVTTNIKVAAGASGLDPYLRIFDANGNELASNDDISFTNLDSQLTFTAPSTGTYYIGVSSYDNSNYLPNVQASGVGNSTGSYTLTVDYNSQLRTASKLYNDVIQLIGHVVTNTPQRDPAHLNPWNPLLLRNNLPGDSGNFNSNKAGQNNLGEGIYIDDIIIGFAERGEQVDFASINTAFTPPPVPPPNNQTGNYELEVRRGPDSIVGAPAFDTNDRLLQGYTLIASPGTQLVDGSTFTVGDGVRTVTFEYNDTTIPLGAPGYGVQSGHIPVPFTPSDPDYLVAQTIRDAINSPSAQNAIAVTAGMSDGLDGSASTSNQVNLYGNAVPEVTQLKVPSTTTDANALANDLLGPGVSLVPGSASLESGQNSAGFFTGGQSAIGIPSGIILSTGDARAAEGPNVDGATSGSSSLVGDPQLDATFGVTTYDTTALQFQFTMAAAGDISFKFVFASEEYNEFVRSGFNDVFAFYVDGTNIALLPGTNIPISIDTVNGGNPFGTMPTNPNFYNNNDPNDGGKFLRDIGYDGFTTVLDARALGLTAGTHTLRLAIADVGDSIYDSAVFIAAGSLQAGTLDTLPTGIRGIRYDSYGDQNRLRQQGQVIISDTSVTNSSEWGIVVDAGQRSRTDLAPLAGALPHPGSVINYPAQNVEKLVPGAVLMNNLVAGNGNGGILVSGDPNAGGPLAPVPFARLINNTVYGTATNDVGIQIEQNVSPSLLNNIVSNFATGISVDASSSTTFVTGTLYQKNATNATGVSNGLGDKAIALGPTEPLFVNPAAGNFYPAMGSQAIDSSVGSTEERAARMSTLTQIGVAPSPIVAPATDITGQSRADDPSINPPQGSGLNPFIDRGAFDRADFTGPIAVLRNPVDNDPNHLDRDPALTSVNLGASQVVSQFSIQFVDGSNPANPTDGTGIDDTTVSSSRLKITYTTGGTTRQLISGVDYVPQYDPTNNILTFNPVAGIWPTGVYVITLDNSPVQFVITAPDGNGLADGEAFQVTDLLNNSKTFEFVGGYRLQIPASGVAVGDTFTVDDGVNPVTFEFSTTGVTAGNVPVVIPAAATQAQVVQAIITTVSAQTSLGMTPQDFGNGVVYLGGSTSQTVTVGSSNMSMMTVVGETVPTISGAIPIHFEPTSLYSAYQSAADIAAAIEGAGLTNVVVTNQGTTVLLQNVSSATDVVDFLPIGPLPPIRDLAANLLRPNQPDGSTQFTITLGVPDSDFGDAPASYGTTLLDNGPRHAVAAVPNPLHMGAGVNIELNGVPSAGANSDSFDDGVTWTGLFAGGSAQFTINSSGPGKIDAWIDLNRDGVFESNEKIFNSVSVVAGDNTMPPVSLAGVTQGDTYARFRLSSAGNLGPTGPAADGEVEDYFMTIGPHAPAQNPTNPYDVNVDSVVNFIDIVSLITVIRTNGFFVISSAPPPTGPFYDVDGNNFVNFFDVIGVLNYLRAGGSPEGAEGEAPASTTTTTVSGGLASGSTTTSSTTSRTSTATSSITTSSISTSSTTSSSTADAGATAITTATISPTVTTQYAMAPASTTIVATGSVSSSLAPSVDTSLSGTSLSTSSKFDSRSVFSGGSLQVSAGGEEDSDSDDSSLLPSLAAAYVPPSDVDEDSENDDPWSSDLDSAIDDIAGDVSSGWQTDEATDTVFSDLATSPAVPLGDKES